MFLHDNFLQSDVALVWHPRLNSGALLDSVTQVSLLTHEVSKGLLSNHAAAGDPINFVIKQVIALEFAKLGRHNGGQRDIYFLKPKSFWL